MTPDPQRRRQTIIPPLASDDADSSASVHRAETVIEGYEPPSPGGATSRSAREGERALYQPEAPSRDEASRGGAHRRTAQEGSGPATGLFGLGPVADVVFLVGLSLVFAAGIGIGAALVGP